MASAFKQTDILLIDANAESLSQTKTSLTEINPNYVIEVAKGYDEAISFVENPDYITPNIAIIDSNNPEELGFKIIKALKGLKKVKVLLVTTEYNSEILAKCGELDCDVIQKSTAQGEFIDQLRAKISKLRRPV